MKFNVNNYVKVKLTERGKAIMKKEGVLREYKADKDGFSKWQLWELMRVFGNYLFNGCEIPFEMEIEISENNG